MEFRKEAPTAQARRLADRELSGNATAGEIAWLHEHPLLWYRALRKIDDRINNTTFQDRTRKAEVRTEMVVSGQPIPQEYLRFKAQADARRRGREAFKLKVEERMQDATSLMGGETVARWMHGDLIMGFYDIGYAINSKDHISAQELIQMWIRRLSEKEFTSE